ncbi:hypothetical protein [Mesorhizobium sp. NBSH29]|nr:hypothetical protein [Mesorhizobium sp. NBSH29]
MELVTASSGAGRWRALDAGVWDVMLEGMNDTGTGNDSLQI